MPARPSVILCLLSSVLCPLAAAEGDPVKIAGRSTPVPADWKAVKPANRLRSHQFEVPSGDPAVAAAEVYVIPDADPDPAKSFPKWKDTFVVPDGKTAEDVGKASKFEANGATVHVLDVSGTWKYKPFPMAKKEELRPDWRVVWVVVAAKDEAAHLRLSGPAAVVGKRYAEFEAWIKGAGRE